MGRRFFARIATKEIGCRLAESLKSDTQALELKVCQFGGVAQFASTEGWAKNLDAIFITPERVRRLPEAFGGGPSTMTDIFRIVYLFRIDDLAHVESDASDRAALIADALSAEAERVGSDEFYQSLWSERRIQVQTSEPTAGPGDFVEWRPAEQAQIDPTNQAVRATAFNWQVTWSARA